MVHTPPTDDALEELSCLREKAEVALGCIIDNAEDRCVQTLTYIASDYLSAMRGMIRAMQESEVAASKGL